MDCCFITELGDEMAIISDQNTSSFAKAVMKLFSLQAIGLGCGFLVHLILASQLNPTEYGIYNFVFSTSMICALVGNFGFQASAVRFIPKIISDEESKSLRDFFSFTSVWIFMLSSFISIIVYLAFVHFNLTDDYPKEALLVGIGLTPILALIKLNSGVLKGFKKGAWALAYESSLKEIFFLVVLVGVGAFLLSVSTAQTSLIIIGTISAILLVASFVHILSLISSQIRLSPQLKELKQKPSYKVWLSISLPMMLVISVQFLIIRSDVIMLGLMTTATDVGVYNAGAKLAQAATITMMVLNIFFSPRAAELFHKENFSGLRRLYFKTLRYQAASTLCLVASLAIGAPYVISFLGADYANALPVIYVLLFGYAINCLWGPIPFLMIMTKYEYQAMWMTFVAAGLNIGLNIFLIPLYGIIGAAISTIVAINLRNGLAFLYIMRRGLLKKEINS